MASVTHLSLSNDTANNQTSYLIGPFTPAVGDLMVAIVHVSGAAATDGSVSLATFAGDSISFSLIASGLKASSADKFFLFVANALITNAVDTSIAFDCGDDDTATGCSIYVAAAASMSRTGSSAVRQTAKQENQAAGGTPAPAFSASALTGNPTIAYLFNNSNPAGVTEPTGWTEQADSGFNTPTRGTEYASRDSGFTGTTITWGSTSATAFGSLIVELDSSAAPAADTPFRMLMGMGT